MDIKPATNRDFAGERNDHSFRSSNQQRIQCDKCVWIFFIPRKINHNSVREHLDCHAERRVANGGPRHTHFLAQAVLDDAPHAPDFSRGFAKTAEVLRLVIPQNGEVFERRDRLALTQQVKIKHCLIGEFGPSR